MENPVAVGLCIGIYTGTGYILVVEIEDGENWIKVISDRLLGIMHSWNPNCWGRKKRKWEKRVMEKPGSYVEVYKIYKDYLEVFPDIQELRDVFWIYKNSTAIPMSSEQFEYLNSIEKETLDKEKLWQYF